MKSRHLGAVSAWILLIGVVALLAGGVSGFIRLDKLWPTAKKQSTEELLRQIKESEEKRDPRLARGRQIAQRLEDECDYWQIEKYIEGDVEFRNGIANVQPARAKVKPGLYGEWGGAKSMFIPYRAWEQLSRADREALGVAVSQDQDVKQIYVGNVVPSRIYEGNSITVDEKVWP